MSQEQVFQTQNTALAATLATVGVPFDTTQDGTPCPFLNYYSPDVMHRLGYTGSGLTLEEAAREAWKKGKPGTLVYCFKRTELFEKVIAAWDKHATLIDQIDERSGGAGQQNLRQLNVDPEVAAALLCQAFKNRKALLEGWRTATPWLCYPGEVHEEQEGGKTYRVGSMKLIRLGASKETRAKVGL